MPRRLLGWLLAGSTFIAPTPSFAADGTTQATVVAETLFSEGQALMDQKRYRAACEKFAASMAAEPSGGTALNLARCHELRGRYASAWANFRRAASLLRGNDERRAAFASERAAELEPKLSRLTIEVAATPGVRVTQDGSAVPSSSWGTALPIDDGEHLIEASADGYQGWSRTIAIKDGGTNEIIRIPLLSAAQPERVEDRSGVSPLLVSGAVLGALGVGALAGGGIVGAMVLGAADDARADPTLCPNEQCSAEGLAAIEDARDKATVSNILLGTGAGLSVLGASLLIAGVLSSGDEPARDDDGSADGGRLRVWPALGPSGAGVSAAVTF